MYVCFFYFKLLLLLRSLKIDFWPFAICDIDAESVELSAKFAPRNFNAVGCEKFNTSAPHELPTNKSAAAACHLRADEQIDKHIGQTCVCCVYAVYTCRHPTNCCERFADAPN